MTYPQVSATYAGCNCVVFMSPSLYIQDTIDRRNPAKSYIEVVRSGHVVTRRNCHTTRAPETIVSLMKEYRQ